MKKLFIGLFVSLMMIFTVLTASASDSISIGKITVNETDNKITAYAYAENSNMLLDEVLVVGGMYLDNTLVATSTQNVTFVAGIKKKIEFSFPKTNYDRIEIFIFKDLCSLAPVSLGASTVEADIEKKSSPFGVLYAMYIDSASFDKTPNAVIYGSDGEFSTYKFASKVKTNSSDAASDYSVVSSDEILMNFGTAASVNQKIVYYSLNANREINEFFYDDGISRNCGYEFFNFSGPYNSQDNTINGYDISESEFVTLNTPSYPNYLDKEAFGTASLNDFMNDNHYMCEMIIDAQNNKALFSVIFDFIPTVPADSPLMLVTSVNRIIDDDDNELFMISGLCDGKEVSFAYNEDDIYITKFDNMPSPTNILEKGDVIQYYKNGNKCSIRLLLNFENRDAIETGNMFGKFTPDGDINNPEFIYAGRMENYDDGEIRFADSNETVYVYHYSPTYMLRICCGYTKEIVTDNISLYNAETDSYCDGENDDRVWIYSYNGEEKLILVLDCHGDTKLSDSHKGNAVVSGFGLRSPFDDLETSDKDFEKFYILNKIGLLNGDEYGMITPDANMTRAEFVTMLVRALGYEDASKILAGTEINYTDVSSDHWAAPYINIAKNKQIISANTSTFRPDENILYSEAVEFLVSALGYRPVCNSSVQLVLKASDLGILNGISGSPNEAATRRLLVNMLYNSLEIPMMEATSVGSDIEYSVPEYDYSTILTLNDIIRISGDVENISFDPTSERSLSISAYETSEPSIYNDPSFTALHYEITYSENTDVFKYYTVNAYITENANGQRELIAMHPQEGNKTVTISTEQLSNDSYNFENLSISYTDENGETVYEKLSPSIEIYSNMSTDPMGAQDFSFDDPHKMYNEIQLIENNPWSDGYDYMILKEYYSGLVASVNPALSTIEFKEWHNGPHRITLDSNSEEYIFTIRDIYGNPRSFNSIAAGSIINVFESLDYGYTYYDVVISSSQITGTVEEKIDDETYIIKGKKYRSVIELNVGDYGIFYQDMYGVVLKFVRIDPSRPVRPSGGGGGGGSGGGGGPVEENTVPANPQDLPYIKSPFADMKSSESGFEAFYVLNKLGYINGYDDGTIKPLDNISRAQFITMLVRVLGYEKVSQSLAGIPTSFNDVNGEHWAAGYINVASTYGIIKETSGNFRPEDNITYGETIEYIISALGYAPLCEKTDDGSGIAYLLKACDLKVIDGDYQLYIEAATRKSVAQMLFNALDVNLMEKTSFGSEIKYEVTDKTLLSKAKITKLYGKTEDVSFANNSNVLSFEIYTSPADDYRLGTYRFNYSPKADIIRFVASEAYVDTSKSEEEIIFMYPDTNADIVHIDPMKLMEINPDSLGYYDENDNYCEVKLSFDLRIYSNLGSEIMSFAPHRFYDAEDITLYSLNNNGIYDVILLEDCESAVVENINAEAGKITLDNGILIILDPKDKCTTFDILDADGNTLEISDIKVDDIISYFESWDYNGNTYQKIIVSSNKIFGKVVQQNDEYIWINGEKHLNNGMVELGDAGIFYIDIYGKIVKFEPDFSNDKYGFLTNVEANTNGIEAHTYARIYDTESETTYQFAEKVLFNGMFIANPQEIFNLVNCELETPVVFTLNQNGEINKFVTARFIRDYNYEMSHRFGMAVYKEKTSSLGSIKLPDDTKILTYSPADRNSYKIYDKSILKDGRDYQYNILCKLDEAGDQVAVFVIIKDLTVSVSADSPVMYVTDIYEASDAPDMYYTVIKGICNGEEIILKVTEDTNVQNRDFMSIPYHEIGIGSPIQYLEFNDELIIRVLLTDNELRTEAFMGHLMGSNQNDRSRGFMFAERVMHISNNSVEFVTGEYYDIDRSAKIALLADNKVYTDGITLSNAEENDIIWLYQYMGETKAAIILTYNPYNTSAEELSPVPAIIDSPYYDVENTDDVFNAIYAIDTLGYLEADKENYYPDLPLTRAEFIKSIVKMTGNEKAAELLTGTPCYEDVPADNSYSGYIAAAKELGVLSSDENIFRPSDNITYSEAIRFTVSALGYAPVCKSNGNTDIAYLMQAQELSLLDKISQKTTEEATRKTIATLLFNALEVPMMENTASDTAPKYEVPYNYKTFLSLSNVARLEGNVAETSTIPEKGSFNYDVWNASHNIYMNNINGMCMNYRIYNPDNKEVFKHYSSVTYVKLNGDDMTLLFMYPKAENKVLMLNSEQIYNGDCGYNYLIYYPDGYRKDTGIAEAPLSDSAQFYINDSMMSVPVSDFSNYYRNGRFTEVKLIENSSYNNGYDVIIGKLHISAIVDDIEGTMLHLKNAYNNDTFHFALNIENNNDEIYNITDINGNTLSVEDIKKGDIITMFVSENGSYTQTDIIVSNNSVEGFVTYAKDNVIKINDTEYICGEWFAPGTSGLFAIDPYGVVLNRINGRTDINYGVQFNSYRFTDSFEEDVEIEIFTKNGEFKKYTFADKIRISDSSLASYSIIPKELLLQDFALIGGYDQKLIAYTLNKDNEIDGFYYHEGIYNEFGWLENIEGRAVYNEETKMLDDIVIPSSIKLITISDNRYQDAANIDKDAFDIADTSIFADGEIYQYELIVSHKKGYPEAVAGVIFQQ